MEQKGCTKQLGPAILFSFNWFEWWKHFNYRRSKLNFHKCKWISLSLQSKTWKLHWEIILTLLVIHSCISSSWKFCLRNWWMINQRGSWFVRTIFFKPKQVGKDCITKLEKMYNSCNRLWRNFHLCFWRLWRCRKNRLNWTIWHR